MTNRFISLLRWSEKYTETDMLYVVKGSFWILFGKIGIFIIAFIKIIIFGRFLTQESYGIYTFIISMAAILAVFSLPGINVSLIKAIAQKKEGTLIVAIKEKLKFSLLGSLASFLISFWYLYNQNYFLFIAFVAVGLLLPTQNTFAIFSSFWNGRKNFARSSKYDLLSTFLVALITVPVIIVTNNPVLIVVALFAAQSIFNGALLIKTIKYKENKEVLPESIVFGKNLTIMNAISLFSGQLDKIIIWKFFGPINLAIYSFAQMPIQKIQDLIPVQHLALPKIGEKKIGEIKDGITRKFKKLFFIFIPLTLLIIFLAPFFYRIILPQYTESVIYFQVLSILFLFTPFLLFDISLISEMKKKDLYIIQTLVPSLKIVLFLITVPFLGIWGIIVSIIISQIIQGILSFYFFKKI